MVAQDNHCAEYIGDITMHLAKMARVEGFEELAFLLEMAALEASGVDNLDWEIAGKYGCHA